MATTFNDSKNRKWDLALNIATVRAVRDETEIDLFSLAHPDKLRALVFDDPARMVDAWWVIIREQAQTANVSDVDFGRAIDGDALENGVSAFVEALIGFFPSRQRAPLAKLWEKVNQVTEAGAARATQILESGKLDQAILNELDRQEANIDAMLDFSGEPSTNSPASSESTPAP